MKFFYLFTLCFSLTFGETIDLSAYKGINNKYSQFGEEGVIKKIFDTIGTTNKYYVDFGAGDGFCCSNSAFLREDHQWEGLLLDGAFSKPEINLYKEWLTKDNICDLFRKYNVPIEPDFISIDIDGNDFYLFDAVCKEYRPRVICVETNRHILKTDYVMPYNVNHKWDGTRYSGMSLKAACKLAKKHGYTFVLLCADHINAFFIRDDILASSEDKFSDQGQYLRVINTLPKNIKCCIGKDPKSRKFISL